MKRVFPVSVVVLLASVVATFAAVTGGCSRPAASAETPPGEAPKPEATVVAPAVPAATPTPEPAATTAAGCTKNEDCHTQSFYCDSCQCLSLGAGQNAPTCKGKQVQCFVDPCMNQKAVCDHGKCMVGAKS